MPICVEPTEPRHRLDVTSRLNYAKVYTVEHNVKVCFIGKIHKDSYQVFKATFDRIFNGDAMNEDDEEVVHPSNKKYKY